MPRPIDLHFWPTPNGYKVSIFLEEAAVPYQLVPVDITKGEQFQPGFLQISPNNRMPAIVDPDGPDGQPISVFESGAILQYLGRKFGQFYPQAERARVEVDQWLFWQMAGLGPMSGQAGHFLFYAPEDIPYAKQRYSGEVRRLYQVMNLRLADRPYLAGNDYTIADMASWPWLALHKPLEIDLAEYPHLQAWYARVGERPGVQRGKLVGEHLRKPMPTDKAEMDKIRKVLFLQDKSTRSAEQTAEQ